MSSTTWHLDCGALRTKSIDRLLDYVMRLPRERRFAVEITEERHMLPSNLLARIKIPVRELAAFFGVDYDEMNEIVHDNFYPHRAKTVAGVQYEVTVASNKLTPDEARKIEADLCKFAADAGCTLSVPTNGAA